MPSLSYSPTDIGTAVATLTLVVLDVLAGAGVIPGLSPELRTTLVASLTVLTAFGITAYIANRGIKHLAEAKVEAAALAATGSPPAA
jgi:hypothetical protein